MKVLPYREGSWFAVPLKSGGYGVGVVARTAPTGKIIVAYLFGPRRDVIPALAELDQMRPGDAVRRVRTGDLGLLNGTWRLIGASDAWQRGEWPMPTFIRRADVVQRAWRATYSETDPSKLEREESVPYDTVGMESDSLYGYGATELLLTKLLN